MIKRERRTVRVGSDPYNGLMIVIGLDVTFDHFWCVIFGVPTRNCCEIVSSEALFQSLGV